MNRDEQLTRAIALPPSILSAGERRAIFPQELSGGTWIAANDAGSTFALINWYAVKNRARGKAISRGTVIQSLLSCQNADEAVEKVLRLPLRRMNPFRLIGFFPRERQILEWRWNQKKLAVKRHSWKTNIWISSGFDEPGAQQQRGAVFAKALCLKSRGTIAWLRRLHRSHRPHSNPYSICMHREDAATVSYTELHVGTRQTKIKYIAGSPCSKAAMFSGVLKFRD